MSFRAPKGTDDHLPPGSLLWRDLLALWEEHARRFGYPPAFLPVFEATELFERGTGGDTDLVQKQMYTFRDRGGRSVTLRPEGTPGIVRAYLAAGGRGSLKTSYSGPMFRYEQPQAARRRQFWQVGVEYIGTPSPLADVEVIELGLSYLLSAGCRPELRINSLGDGVCRPAYLDLLRSFLRERRDLLGNDARRRMETNPLRVLDSKEDAPHLGGAPAMIDHLCDPCGEHHGRVKAGLDALGILYVEDRRLVRGLDYYTRTAFEYIAPSLEAAQNALGGGGRYDGLAETLGGKPTPGVGFALGIDRIALASGRRPGPVVAVYAVAEDVAPENVLAFSSRLRAAGVTVDFDPEGRSAKAQFRAAERSGAEVVILVGSEKVEVRAGDQRRTMTEPEVLEWLLARR